MDSNFLQGNSFSFVVVFIIAIIIAIQLAYTTLRDRRKGGSDQRKTSNRSDLSDFGSGHHGIGHDDGGDFGRGDWVTATFLTKLKCLLQMHEGEWTTDGLSGCWQRYICRYCGVIEQLERHIWPDPYVGEYFKDGSCETRVTCLHCGKTELTGITHESQIYKCRRCGEYLGGGDE